MNNIIKRVWNQNRMVNVEDLRGMAFQAEDGGHTFEISGVNDAGESVPLSGTVAGVFMRPDGADVALTGTASDGVVSVTLSEACYAVAGRFGLTIFVTDDSKKTCVYACIGTVAQTSYGTVAGDTPQDVVDLINAINAAIASIPADYSDLMAAVAPTYSSSALYSKGAYAWYDGVLYKAVVDISTAESWTDTHWEKVQISSELVLINDAIKRGYSLADDWERGNILSNGALQNSTTKLRSSHFYDIGGKTITVSCNPAVASSKLKLNIYKYNFDGTFVSTVSFPQSIYYPRSITLDSGYVYKFVWTDSTNATTYASDIAVRIPNEIEYVPSVILTEITNHAYDLTMADALIRAEKRNPFALAPFEKGYVTFVWDDLNTDIDLVASIFAEYGFPIGIGAIPSKLSDIASGLQADSHGYTVGMTMQDICEQVVDDGGEIMAHGNTIITADNQYDYNFMYNHYITVRKQLESAGFDIRGFIRVGGGTVTHTPEIERWLIGNFEYSNDGIAANYYQERITIDNTLNNLKESVLAAKTNNTWVKFMCHKLYANDTQGITEANLRELLDYITEIGLDVVTYAYIFDNYSSSAFLQS
jgi:hypothetical protein